LQHAAGAVDADFVLFGLTASEQENANFFHQVGLKTGLD
jgi:hypothetical protein